MKPKQMRTDATFPNSGECRNAARAIYFEKFNYLIG